jgi:hypothetical protein
MIVLDEDRLVFTFPEIHSRARLDITFKRTLRIPDDNKLYPLPLGLGAFPLEHIDDFAENVPPEWIGHGGVMLPIHQAEAMYIEFDSQYIGPHRTRYPFAVKVAAGKINAITGEAWRNDLVRDPQDYVVSPGQAWLDGYYSADSTVRQFVAMPLGDGYSAEGQVGGKENIGGLQIVVYPMKREAFERHWPERPERASENIEYSSVRFSRSRSFKGMALGVGGRMRQDVYKDCYDFPEWETGTFNRCFVHLANSKQWKLITGQSPPTKSPSPKDYSRNELPWFEHYADLNILSGGTVLGRIKGIFGIGQNRNQDALPGNDPLTPKKIIKTGPHQSPDQVRERDHE